MATRDKQSLTDEYLEAWRESETPRFNEAARLIDIAENTPDSYILLCCNGDPIGLYSSHDMVDKASQSYEEYCRSVDDNRKRFYKSVEIDVDKWPGFIDIKPLMQEEEIIEKEKNEGR